MKKELKMINQVEVKNVYKNFGDVKAVDGVSLEISQGQFFSLLGPSGCGKTTLLNCLSGLDSIDSGAIKLQNMELGKLSDDKLSEFRAKNMGFVFQSFNLINYKSAVDNVILPLYYQGIKRKEREKTALDYLDNVGLKNWASHLPSELSGGQKQRVAIARAMVSKPKVLLADEPTGALDSSTSSDVMSLIQKINNSGKTILVVTHEEDIAKMCKRIVRLKDGVIVEDKKINQKVL